MTNNSVSIRLVLSFAALAVVAAAGVLRAGPINPPAGPVASTAKPLADIEPRIAISAASTPGGIDSIFKITQPGSYYLTGNITGVAAKHGIEIAASGVTLDLMGFDLRGVAGSLDGVTCTLANASDLAVSNGSIRNWGQDGLDFFTAITFSGTVTCLRVSGNSGIGLRTGNNSVVTGCSAYSNPGGGIGTASGCTVTNCSAQSNTGTGINAGGGGTIMNCSATSNTGDGISTGSGGTISNCSAASNTLNGIRVSSDCTVRGNTCDSNGNGGDGAGILAGTFDNRIEGNNCTRADRGIEVGGAGNIIIGNTCSGNTIDWVIALQNVFGPILDRRAPAAAAVSGFSAASTLATTDPNANFSY